MLWAHLELTLTRSFYGHVLQWPLHLGPTYANLRQPTPGVLYGMCLSKPLDSINVTTALSLCTFSITYHHNYCKHLSCGLDMIAMLWLPAVSSSSSRFGLNRCRYALAMLHGLSAVYTLTSLPSEARWLYSICICLCSNFLCSIWFKCSNWSTKCLYNLPCTLDTYVYTCVMYKRSANHISLQSKPM